MPFSTFYFLHFALLLLTTTLRWNYMVKVKTRAKCQWVTSRLSKWSKIYSTFSFLKSSNTHAAFHLQLNDYFFHSDLTLPHINSLFLSFFRFFAFWLFSNKNVSTFNLVCLFANKSISRDIFSYRRKLIHLFPFCSIFNFESDLAWCLIRCTI